MPTYSYYPFGAELCKALRLDQHLVKKLVIEVNEDDAVKVYVKGLLHQSDAPAVVEWAKMIPVKDVEVGDDCTVVTTLHDAR